MNGWLRDLHDWIWFVRAVLASRLVGEVVQYEDAYRLCYIRRPEGLLIGLAEELGQTAPVSISENPHSYR